MDAVPLDWRPDSVYVQAGVSTREARVAGVGMRWNAPRPSRAVSAGWSAAVDVTLSVWSAPVSALGDQREHTTHWAVVPTLRWQLHEGRSPWFAEAGLGVSLHHHHYRVAGVVQSSRWNFQEVIALGRRLGDSPEGRGENEVSLRVAHLSNGGLRRPNPGETWWAVRWSHSF